MQLKTHVCNWTNEQGRGLCGTRLFEGEEHRHPPEHRITIAEFRKIKRPRGRPKKLPTRPFVLKKMWPIGKQGTHFLVEARDGKLWMGYTHLNSTSLHWSPVTEVEGK